MACLEASGSASHLKKNTPPVSWAPFVGLAFLSVRVSFFFSAAREDHEEVGQVRGGGAEGAGHDGEPRLGLEGAEEAHHDDQRVEPASFGCQFPREKRGRMQELAFVSCGLLLLGWCAKETKSEMSRTMGHCPPKLSRTCGSRSVRVACGLLLMVRKRNKKRYIRKNGPLSPKVVGKTCGWGVKVHTPFTYLGK